MYGFCIKSVCVYKYFFFPFSPCAVRLFPIKSASISRRKLSKKNLGKGEQRENGKKENMRKKIRQFNSFKQWS